MAKEIIHEIDQDDLEDYRELLAEQTKLEMRLLHFQSYLEQKYLAGSEYEDGDCYIDWTVGAIYMWYGV